MSLRDVISWPCSTRNVRFLAILGAIALVTVVGLAQEPRPRVKVEIKEDKTEIVEDVVLPVDPFNRVQAQFGGSMTYGLTVDGARLTFSSASARTSFKIDDQVIFPNAPGKGLNPGKGGKQRIGQTSVFQHGQVKITQVMEAVPGKPQGKGQAGQKRKMDTLLVRYLIENLDTKEHKVGVRMRIDTYCRNTDGCLFANPEMYPNKILDGIELKDKKVPDYLMILEQPNLQNPGHVAYFTFRCGSKLEGPNRVVLTAHALGDNGWDVPAQQANGDSDAVFYWEPVAVPAGGKREVAYAHGGGLASGPESEGKVNLVFGGSFEPGKTFTVAAYVDDPLEGQHLTLELPAGMARLEGKATQPVPAPMDSGTSMVLWKASVTNTGDFALRLKSSNGVTLTRNIRITQGEAQSRDR